jgi:hypothetical protein
VVVVLLDVSSLVSQRLVLIVQDNSQSMEQFELMVEMEYEEKCLEYPGKKDFYIDRNEEF